MLTSEVFHWWCHSPWSMDWCVSPWGGHEQCGLGSDDHSPATSGSLQWNLWGDPWRFYRGRMKLLKEQKVFHFFWVDVCFLRFFWDVLLMRTNLPEYPIDQAMADELMEVSGESLSRESELHGSTPIGSLIGEKLKQLRGDLLQPLQPQQHSRQAGIDSAQGLIVHIQWRACATSTLSTRVKTCHSAFCEVISRLLAFSRKAFEHANWIVTPQNFGSSVKVNFEQTVLYLYQRMWSILDSGLARYAFCLVAGLFERGREENLFFDCQFTFHSIGQLYELFQFPSASINPMWWWLEICGRGRWSTPPMVPQTVGVI